MHGSLYTRSAALALGMGIPLSPDTMVLLGHFMGTSGWVGPGLLAAVAALYAGVALNMRADPICPPRPFSFLPLAVKGSTGLFLSTGILVSSGFVFNEVFLYWFPNFGFAFLLLAIVLAIQLSGTDTAIKAQILFTGLTLTCFLILIFSGLGRSEAASSQASSAPGMTAISLPLLLFVGFDLAWAGPDKNKGKATALSVIAGAGLLFILWGLVSITHVPWTKLSASSVPHMKTAGALMGQTGRSIMGAAVILGTLSAVNALFLACRYITGQLANQGQLPLWMQKAFFVPLILALGIGAMMASGMAGSDKLELWIRAAFALWLLTYIRLDQSLIKLALTTILAVGVTTLVLSGDRPLLTILYMVTILGAGLVPGLISILISTLKTNQRSLS